MSQPTPTWQMQISYFGAAHFLHIVQPFITVDEPATQIVCNVCILPYLIKYLNYWGLEATVIAGFDYIWVSYTQTVSMRCWFPIPGGPKSTCPISKSRGKCTPDYLTTSWVNYSDCLHWSVTSIVFKCNSRNASFWTIGRYRYSPAPL